MELVTSTGLNEKIQVILQAWNLLLAITKVTLQTSHGNIQNQNRIIFKFSLSKLLEFSLLFQCVELINKFTKYLDVSNVFWPTFQNNQSESRHYFWSHMVDMFISSFLFINTNNLPEEKIYISNLAKLNSSLHTFMLQMNVSCYCLSSAYVHASLMAMSRQTNW